MSSILQNAIENELISNLEEPLMKYVSKKSPELDFDPIQPRKRVSDLVSGMRYDREDRLSGQ